jgi:hypothetical protein
VTGDLRRKHSSAQICPNKTQAKWLGFAWFYSCESGLFKALRRIQINFPGPASCPFRYALLSWLGSSRLLMFRAADGLVHREHLTGDSDFSKELSEKLRAPAAVHAFERTWV